MTTAAIAAAQQVDEVRVSAHVYTPPQAHITAQTSLVQMEVVVRDARGRPVSGLTPADFEILDDNKPRPIAAFSVETRAAPAAPAKGPKLAVDFGPPRSILLFFDDLHTSPAEMQHMQQAALRFLKRGLGPGSLAAVYTSSQGLTLPFTGDVVALTAAIQKLHARPHISEAGLQPCPRITPYAAFQIERNDIQALTAAVREFEACLSVSDDITNPTGTVGKAGLYTPVTSTFNPINDPHAMSKMSVEAQASATMQQVRADSLASLDAIGNCVTLLARTPGTRILVMVSSGFISGMLDKDRDRLVDRALHSAITINALDAKGLWSRAPGREAETFGALPPDTYLFEETSNGSRDSEMNSVMQALASGTGGLFFHNSNDLAGGLAELVEVPETAYLIAFRSEEGEKAGQFHTLKARLAAKNGESVQTRPGYVTVANAANLTPMAPRPIDHEILVSETLTQIPLQLAGRLGKGVPNDPSLSLVMHVDVSRLKFAGQDGRYVQKLTFVGELVDARGNMITAKEGAMEFALKDDTLARLKTGGVNATLALNAPPGAYMVRVVVADAEGRMAAQNQTVMIGK